MSKGLEALERLSTVASMYCDECATSEEDLDSGMFEKDYQAVKTIEKELKALEIIRNKEIDIWVFNSNDNFNDYNWAMALCYHRENTSNYCLTEEEYDLLKEVLL